MSGTVIRYIHTWRHDQQRLVFHTIPMLHIASLSYYDRINEIINDFNHVLIEGVASLPTKEIGTYRRLARAANLVPQIDHIRIPEDIPSINIDLRQDIFYVLYKKLPLRQKLQLHFYDLIAMTLTTQKTSRFHGLMVSTFKYPEEYKHRLIDPKNHYAFKHKQKPPLELLAENCRNEAIQTNITAYIKQNEKRLYRFDVGILFGDGHMPYIYEILTDEGFAWRLEETIIVF